MVILGRNNVTSATQDFNTVSKKKQAQGWGFLPHELLFSSFPLSSLVIVPNFDARKHMHGIPGIHLIISSMFY